VKERNRELKMKSVNNREK